MSKYSVYYQPREFLDAFGAADTTSYGTDGVSQSPVTVTGTCVLERVSVPTEIMGAFGANVDHTSVSLVTDEGGHYPLLFSEADTTQPDALYSGKGSDMDKKIAQAAYPSGQRVTIQGTAFNNNFLLPESIVPASTEPSEPSGETAVPVATSVTVSGRLTKQSSSLTVPADVATAFGLMSPISTTPFVLTTETSSYALVFPGCDPSMFTEGLFAGFAGMCTPSPVWNALDGNAGKDVTVVGDAIGSYILPSSITVSTQATPETQTCPDGSVIPLTDTCPSTQPTTQTCPDGSVISASETCPSGGGGGGGGGGGEEPEPTPEPTPEPKPEPSPSPVPVVQFWEQPYFVPAVIGLVAVAGIAAYVLKGGLK
jgi:hypothetical protein